jgi:pimeloyl-ACP methyl ester carboxylesterase
MAERETVILVHGLWVHGVVMSLMKRRIARCGYDGSCFSYPSMRRTLTENAERLAEYCRGIRGARIHFVAHSMGGLVVLKMLESPRAFATGRVVLLGTPYGGSYAARRLTRIPGGRAALGCCLPEWLGRERPQPPAHRDIGVIAGRVGIGLGRIVAPEMTWPNDGVVAVAETEIPQAQDHIVLAVNHTGMLLSHQVVQQACAFIRAGTFLH